MRRLYPLYILEEGRRAALRQHREAFSQILLVDSVRDSRKGMEAGGHAGEAKEAVAAMEHERPQPEDVAREQQLTPMLIPERECEFTDDSIERAGAPGDQSFEQDRRVASSNDIGERQAERACEFFAIVDSNIGDERVWSACDRTAIVRVFRNGRVQASPDR
jgi:hypothetical protein